MSKFRPIQSSDIIRRLVKTWGKKVIKLERLDASLSSDQPKYESIRKARSEDFNLRHWQTSISTIHLVLRHPEVRARTNSTKRQ